MTDSSKGSDFGPVEINTDDFKSMKLKIDYTNNITKVAIKDGFRLIEGKFQKGDEGGAVVLLTEIDDKKLILETPSKLGSSGHSATIKLKTEGAKDGDIEFEATGKLEKVESMDSERDQVTFRMIQFEEAEWIAFQKVFSSKQAELEDLFKTLRGY